MRTCAARLILAILRHLSGARWVEEIAHGATPCALLAALTLLPGSALAALVRRVGEDPARTELRSAVEFWAGDRDGVIERRTRGFRSFGSKTV
jgi:hypothetical protein